MGSFASAPRDVDVIADIVEPRTSTWIFGFWR
jgi:hypothetical protein